MDGVVVNTEPLWNKGNHQFYQSLNVSWTQKDSEFVTGKSVHDIYVWLKSEKGLKLSEATFTHLLDQRAVKIYKYAPLLPHIKTVLKKLKKSRYQVGLVSSSRPNWIQAVLKHNQLKQYFDIHLSFYDIAGKGKPAPDIYLHAAKILKTKPEKCLVIEDSSTGVKSAKAAGMKCLALKTKSNPNQDLSLSDAIITSLPQLFSHLQPKS